MSEIREGSLPRINNPNSIGELIVVNATTDIPTSQDKVYRSILGRGAIDDLFNCGYVRNRQSAGLVERNRWGETVFWSRGVDGKFHNVQDNGFVIEAPFEVASKGIVREEDVTAIYAKDEEGKIVNILEEERLNKRAY